MEFYISILRMACKTGDLVYNVYGGSKPVYAALVSDCVSKNIFKLLHFDFSAPTFSFSSAGVIILNLWGMLLDGNYVSYFSCLHATNTMDGLTDGGLKHPVFY